MSNVTHPPASEIIMPLLTLQDLPRLWAIQSPPAVAAVSLYKYDGVMQLNKLVLTGLVAAANKWFIEFVQLQIARGRWAWISVWMCIEMVMTVIVSVLCT